MLHAKAMVWPFLGVKVISFFSPFLSLMVFFKEGMLMPLLAGRNKGTKHGKNLFFAFQISDERFHFADFFALRFDDAIGQFAHARVFDLRAFAGQNRN